MVSRARRLGLVLLLVGSLVVTATVAGEHLRLTTTTSTENSGLLSRLLPVFEQETGIKVDVIAVGSGKALKLAENGDADVVLSHAPDLEAAFLSAGFGVDARPVMWNDFVIVGPATDPARIRGLPSAAAAMRAIATASATFISRADESGTHQKERELWKAAGVQPGGSWYVEAGQGMGEVLIMANERRAYTLADRGTFSAFRKKVELEALVEGDTALRNPYRVIAVNPARHPHLKHGEARKLIEFLTGPKGQKLIGEFRVDGEELFHPVAPGAR